MFAELLSPIKHEISHILLLVSVKALQTGEGEVTVKKVTDKYGNKSIKSKMKAFPPPPPPKPKVGRNDLCPCGSQKKYKNCHRSLK